MNADDTDLVVFSANSAVAAERKLLVITSFRDFSRLQITCIKMPMETLFIS